MGLHTENLQTSCGDFDLRRADGVYAYQLAVVVTMPAWGSPEVVRGADLLSSTARQLYLYQLLGLPAPPVRPLSAAAGSGWTAAVQAGGGREPGRSAGGGIPAGRSSENWPTPMGFSPLRHPVPPRAWCRISVGKRCPNRISACRQVCFDAGRICPESAGPSAPARAGIKRLCAVLL